MHNTKHKTNSNFNTPLFNHTKTQKYFFHQVIPIWNSLQNSLKNCTSKFTFKKQIKSHLLASQSYQCFISGNSSKLIVDVYTPPCLVLLLILEFFPARLAMLPYGLDSKVTKPQANLLTKPSVF